MCASRPAATLLSGGSGSGKSTLMDSYIALIMPHTTPFNGASNGGVVGRPRGKEQRNILSYARGKLDETRTDGETKLRVLRGDGTRHLVGDRDDLGRPRRVPSSPRVRAWYVPSSARTPRDTSWRCAPPGRRRIDLQRAGSGGRAPVRPIRGRGEPG